MNPVNNPGIDQLLQELNRLAAGAGGPAGARPRTACPSSVQR